MLFSSFSRQPQSSPEPIHKAAFLHRAVLALLVNLFLPSRVSRSLGGTPVTLTQKTSYPTSNTTQLELEMPRPETFTIFLRVPAWADAKTRISVNGKKVEGEVVAGKFFELSRTWKGGDRVEYEIEMPLSLQAVDPENPQIRKHPALVRPNLMVRSLG